MNILTDGKGTQSPNAAGRPGADGAPNRSKLRVFVMDLWCIIPYYTAHLCTSLKEQNVEVVLGSISYHFDPACFEKVGLKNDPGVLDIVGKFRIRQPMLRRGLKFVESCINMAVLPLRFALDKPDIIHVQYIPLVEEGLPMELWLLRAARLMGIKLVYTVHNELPMDTGVRHANTFRRVYQLMDALICHTAAAKDAVVSKYGVDLNRISVIPHGPLFNDAARPSMDKARAVAGVAADETVVLWQGWIKPYKGIDFLLDGWKLVAARAPKAKLVIAGSGDAALMQDIRAKVAALGIEDSVRLDLRFVPPEELPSFYTAADIVVYPYREITTSGALMTALSYGKAIVATRLPYFEESVGSAGAALIVDYGDEQALASALLQFIEDPHYRDQIGARAARLAQTSSTEWLEIARETRRCYEQVCGLTQTAVAE